jgi:hypothetical protein
VHLVGGKLDLAMANPALRAVPFEQACAYAEENLDDMQGEQPVGDDLSCHEVSAKDDTGTLRPSPKTPPPLCYDPVLVCSAFKRGLTGDRGGRSLPCDIAKVG